MQPSGAAFPPVLISGTRQGKENGPSGLNPIRNFEKQPDGFRQQKKASISCELS